MNRKDTETQRSRRQEEFLLCAFVLQSLHMLFPCVHLQATEFEQKATKRTKNRASPSGLEADPPPGRKLLPSFASLPSVQRIGVQLWLRLRRAEPLWFNRLGQNRRKYEWPGSILAYP